MINVILQFLELDLVNINVSAKFYQNIPNGLRVKISLFSEFEPRPNLDQSQMSFDYLMGYIMSISICMQNFITEFPLSSRDRAIFTLSGFGAQLMKNVISQSLGLDLVNINVYAKVYQNIPLRSRDRAIFTFSDFEPRQHLGQSQMTFDNLLGYILSRSICMQNFIKILETEELSTFFTNRPALSPGENLLCIWLMGWGKTQPVLNYPVQNTHTPKVAC